MLLGGLIDLGPGSRSAQEVFDLLARRKLGRPRTAWHCCLEFYSVSTRLPEEFRLTPSDAAALLEQEVFGRMEVLDLPARRRLALLQRAARESIRGGRLYDFQIAAIAQSSGSQAVVTENVRHFAALESAGIRVWNCDALLAAVGNRKGSS